MDAVSVGEYKSINTLASIDESVQALSIFDKPHPVFPSNFGVQSRDAVGWNLDIVACKTTYGQNRFVQLAFADDLSIQLDYDTGLYRG